ncbi:MAG: c-type cytochrome domain-containing protein [Bacteroidota bacterium]
MKNSKSLTGLLDFSVIAFIVFLIMMMMFWGCKHEPFLVPSLLPRETPGSSDTTSYNESPCNPDSVYFANNVLPLFISNCAKSGCHDAASHEDGIILNSYSNIISTGDIEAGNPSAGKIVEKISETDPDNVMPPPPNTPLTAAQINMITNWINQGALNNSCNGCEPVNVTYSGTVAPLLQSKCVGCHNNTTTSGNINLSGYAGAQQQALNGRLTGAVTHSSGYSPMPKGGTKLPQCEIDELIIWIADGAPNN